MTAAAVLLLAAIANAMRGGRYPAVNGLPGHTRIYASLAFVALAYFWTRDPFRAGVWGACYLAWSLPPWGRWFDLGNAWPRLTRAPTWFEKIIEKAAGGNVHVAFGLRNAVGLVPAALLISPLILLMVAAQHAAYAFAWFIAYRRAIELAEYLTGLAWGAALILL